MPRRAREKSSYAIYHVISRSISEVMLFIDNSDKAYYLKLLKRYLDRYRCSLYAYCLMSNHIHLHLDTKGFDISTFMHSLNTAYVRYFNKKYDRHGHLFQGRFGSRILYNEAYNLAVSAYIHNNPKDMPEYAGREEDYEFSSYGIYLGTMPDYYDIIDKSFIKSLFGIEENNRFARHYHEFVLLRKGALDISDVSNMPDAPNETAASDILPDSDTCEYISGRTVLIRELAVPNIIKHISDKLGIIHQAGLLLKSRRNLAKYRAFVAYSLRVLCNLSYKSICKHLVNITISGCSRLCSKGYELVCKDALHLQIFNELISYAN
jgi:putative transposase